VSFGEGETVSALAVVKKMGVKKESFGGEGAESSLHESQRNKA
jgi:hypothetical protein